MSDQDDLILQQINSIALQHSGDAVTSSVSQSVSSFTGEMGIYVTNPVDSNNNVKIGVAPHYTNVLNLISNQAGVTKSGRVILNDSIFVQCWGAGGAGGTIGGWTVGSYGGGGGYAEGYLINVPYGTVLNLVVGGRGVVNSRTSAFGGGGYITTDSDNRYGGGGGYSGIFIGNVTQANALIIAGGGGGGGSSRASFNNGGAGGGWKGQDGLMDWDGAYGTRGRGATQFYAGQNAYNVSSGANQSAIQGALQGGNPLVNSYGGAGGGGYFGGSGGAYQESNTMAGGGGGSGYVNTNYITESELLTGDLISSGGTNKINWLNTTSTGGQYQQSGLHGMIAITKNGIVTIFNHTGSLQTYTVY